MTTNKKTVSPRLSQAAEAFIVRYFPNRNKGAQFAIEAFSSMCSSAIDNMRGVFSGEELSVIVEAYRRVDITNAQPMKHRVLDSIADVAIGRDIDIICKKLRVLDPFSCLCLEVWASGFWSHRAEVKDITRWTKMLE